MKNYKSKVCLICGKEFKPTTNNQKYCMECKRQAYKEQKRQWYKEHPEYEKQYEKQRYKDPLGKRKQYDKQYYKEHLEERKQHDKQYYKDHSEKRKQYEKQYRQTKQGREISNKAKCKRRRNLGFIPLNQYFEGSEAHHLDTLYVIYIPKEIHHSIYHSVLQNINMDEINALAFNYFSCLQKSDN